MSTAAAAAPPPMMPPRMLSRHMDALKEHARPLFWGVAALFAPLALCILAAWLLLHSALVVCTLDVAHTWLSYGAYLVWHRRGTLHSRLKENAMLLGFHLPLMVALITLRCAMHASIARHMGHTTQRKRRAVIGFALAYAFGIWIAFRDVAAECVLIMAKLDKDAEVGVTPSSLFLSLYNATLLFSLVSIASTMWVPTSEEHLRRAEQALLDAHKTEAAAAAAASKKAHREPSMHFAANHSYMMLEADDDESTATVTSPPGGVVSPASPEAKAGPPPVVFLHGFAAGKAFWFRNLHSIHSALGGSSRLYALDLFGMGLSSSRRTMDHCSNSTEAEDYFVRELEAWRAHMHIDRMVLVGHSFGGYISACYAMRHPERVAHLVLASPVGLPTMPPFDPKAPSRAPYWAQKYGLIHALRWLWSQHITLSMGLHLLGPIGPRLFTAIVRGRFAHLGQGGGKEPNPSPVDVAAIAAYVYHLNAGACPGHRGLNLLLQPGAYAFDPLLPRLTARLSSAVTLLYGANDWMDAESGHKLVASLVAARTSEADLDAAARHAECLVLPSAGHQLFLENAPAFNAAVVRAAKLAKDWKPTARRTPRNNQPQPQTVDHVAKPAAETTLHQRAKKTAAPTS